MGMKGCRKRRRQEWVLKRRVTGIRNKKNARENGGRPYMDVLSEVDGVQ